MARHSSLQRRVDDLHTRRVPAGPRSGRIARVALTGLAICTLGLILAKVLTERSSVKMAKPLATQAGENADASPIRPELGADELAHLAPITVDDMDEGEQNPFDPVTLSFFEESNEADFSSRLDPTMPRPITIGHNRSTVLHARLNVENAALPMEQSGVTVESDDQVHVVSVVKPHPETPEQPAEPDAISPEVEEEWKDDTEQFFAEAAAIVNGEPLLNRQILSRYSVLLKAKRAEWMRQASQPNAARPGQPVHTVDDFKMLREQIIQGNISGFVQKMIIGQTLKAEMTPEEKSSMDQKIDQLFEVEIEKLKKERNVSTVDELESDLVRLGTSLQDVKNNFVLDRLPTECIAIKFPTPLVEAAEVQEYYESQTEQFVIPATVTWRGVSVDLSEEVSRDQAFAKLKSLLAELPPNQPLERKAFNERFQKDSSLSHQDYDAMKHGSLVDEQLERQIFSMPLNRWSQPIESRQRVCIAFVTQRHEASRQPFAEVEQEIRTKLQMERQADALKQFMIKVFPSVRVVTSYTLNFPTAKVPVDVPPSPSSSEN